MKYKICSYPLQDGRWGSAFMSPPSFDGQSATFSEPYEFGEYFQTKERADNHAIQFLKSKGVKDEEIETQKDEQ